MSFNVYQISHSHFEDIFQNTAFQVTAAETVGSTNDLAKQEAFSLSTPLKIYLSDRQEHGRGRGTNTWSNPPPGASLMATFSMDMTQPPQPICTPLAGLFLYRALLEHFAAADDLQAHLSIKAPNDILLRGKKLSGLLTEVVQMGDRFRLLVGLGLNVWGSPADVPTATSLNALAPCEQTQWKNFLSDLVLAMQAAARGSVATHLSESERSDLLTALNRNPNLTDAYESVSPFGDLGQGSKTVSWRLL